jgi:hypothetical protein
MAYFILEMSFPLAVVPDALNSTLLQTRYQGFVLDFN